MFDQVFATVRRIRPSTFTTSVSCARYVFLSAVVLCLIVPSVSGQVAISGRVIDSETKEPLPAAGIRIEGTALGTITNGDGRFVLQIDEVPATLIFRYVGFQSERVRITGTSPPEIEVSLTPATVSLNEIVVTGENPAIQIMQRVIDRKQAMRASLETYRADAYNRFTISNDTGIVSILESFTQAYWKESEGLREVNLSQRQTQNMEFDELLPAAMFVANLYDDNIDIGGFNLRGVTHPDALDHYRFKVASYVYLDDQLIYEIAVEPKNDRKTGFKGMLRVLADEYVLIEVNLTPGKAVFYPPPFESFQTVLYQQYSDYGDGQWLPSDLHSSTNIKISFGVLFEFPEIHIEQLSRLSNYVINSDIPDSLFDESKNQVVRADSTISDDELISWSVPLTARELEAYDSIDSTATLEQAFKPTGLLSKAASLGFSTGSNDSDGSTSGTDSLDGFLGGRGIGTRFVPDIAYNRVEGFRAGLNLVAKGGRKVRYETRLGGSYQTARKDWGYVAGAGIATGQKVEVGLDALYEKGIAKRYETDVFDEAATSVMSLFGHPDYFDYYGREGFKVTPFVYYSPYAIRISASYDAASHGSLIRNTSYDLVGRSGLQPVNPMINGGDMRSVALSVVINEPETTLPVAGSRSLSLTVEHSSPDVFNSDFDFTQFTGRIDWRLKTFNRRRIIPQTLDARFIVSVHDGALPAQKLAAIDASNGIYTPFGSLRAAGDHPFEGDDAIAFLWEHNFRTAPFEMIGAWGLARNGITVALFGGHAKTTISDETRTFVPFTTNVSDGWYHEVGASIGGILGIFRIDFAKQLGGSNASVGVSVARLF